jgi:hypothetical protein
VLSLRHAESLAADRRVVRIAPGTLITALSSDHLK